MNLDELFTQIARQHLDIQTLQQRGRDHLDFHDVSIHGVRRALAAAYEAGRDSMRRRKTPNQPKNTPHPRP